jgi:hypothetical protein
MYTTSAFLQSPPPYSRGMQGILPSEAIFSAYLESRKHYGVLVRLLVGEWRALLASGSEHTMTVSALAILAYLQLAP